MDWRCASREVGPVSEVCGLGSWRACFGCLSVIFLWAHNSSGAVLPTDALAVLVACAISVALCATLQIVVRNRAKAGVVAAILAGPCRR